MFFLMRVVRGLCGYLAGSVLVFGIPSTVLALLASGPDKGTQVLVLLFQISILFLCGWLFFWLRGFINRLHVKKYGVRLPALAEKKWAL
jgi:predicted permease